jgi:hypothetical protein
MKKIKYGELRFSEKEKANMVTEIGILQMYETPYIVNCVEAFDANNCAFIVLEMMEKEMTKLTDR